MPKNLTTTDRSKGGSSLWSILNSNPNLKKERSWRITISNTLRKEENRLKKLRQKLKNTPLSVHFNDPYLTALGMVDTVSLSNIETE